MNVRAGRRVGLSAVAFAAAFGVGCPVSGQITGGTAGRSSTGGNATGATGSGPGGSVGGASTASGNGGTTGKNGGGTSSGKSTSSGGKGTSGGGNGPTSGGGNGPTSGGGNGPTSSGGNGPTSSGGNGTSGGTSSNGGGGTSNGGTTNGGTSNGGTTSNGGSTGGCPTGPSYAGFVGVLERANDSMRDGVFQDPAFTKTALAGLQADPTFVSASWNGPVFSQPLYFSNSAIGHDLVIVTTDSNEIYALDATTGTAVWSDPALVPYIDLSLMASCGGSVNPIGITGTPVIDASTRTMYVNAGTVVAGAAHYQIIGINLDDGSMVGGAPLVDVEGVTVSYAGGTRPFATKVQNQRGALALLNGTLYVPYGGLDGDCDAYRGVVLSVPLSNPSATLGWETAANSGGGIWGPSGVASDGTSVFVATGNTNDNPSFPTLWPNANSEAIIRLVAGNPPTFSGNSADYMAPSDPSQNWYTDDVDDADLGSSGVVLFNAPGANPSDLSFAIGKTGNAYLAQRSNLGGISMGVSEIAGASGGVFGSMAAYTSNGVTYVVADASGNGTCGGNMSTFTVSHTSPPVLGGGWCTGSGGWGSPIVSTSDGTNDYVVWGIGGSPSTTITLDAVDGDTGNLIVSLGAGNVTHWVTPIIAKGAVYVAGNNQVYKFSLPCP